MATGTPQRQRDEFQVSLRVIALSSARPQETGEPPQETGVPPKKQAYHPRNLEKSAFRRPGGRRQCSLDAKPRPARRRATPPRGISCAAHIRPTAPAQCLPRSVNRPLPPPLTPPNKHRLPPNRPPFARPGDALTAGTGKLGAGLAMGGQEGGHGLAVTVEVRTMGPFRRLRSRRQSRPTAER